MIDMPRITRELPLLSSSDISLNLDRQRKQAKRLRDAARRGDASAIKRLGASHPRPGNLDFTALKLADAQCVIAREAGLPSWPALKAHVADMEATRAEIEAGSPAPDADLPTLHIRCGNDIEGSLTRAGFDGTFLMFADPICQGPVSTGPDYLTTRARFIAEEYPGEDEQVNRLRLAEAEDLLAEAETFGRIVLWFEHDPYDQLLLAWVLTRLRQTGSDRRKVELISLDRFPGISKFIGIGQLSPTALRHLYAKRIPVADAAYGVARQTVDALCAPSPEPLFALAQAPSQALPFLPDAILRYLRELPSTRNGLSFTEETALHILRQGPLPWGKVFARFMNQEDPLPYHGDLMFLGTLLRLSGAAVPAATCSPSDHREVGWGKAEFALTETGRALLAGKTDWSACGPRLRHHGGLTCFGTPDWRWNPELEKPASV